MGKYSKEFKSTAIKTVLDGGGGLRYVSAHFQMDTALLRRWVEAYKLHGEASFKARTTAHSPEFKLCVLERMWREQLSFRQTAAIFNLGNSSQIGTWQKRYYSGGFEALRPGSKGVRTSMSKLPTAAIAPPLTTDESPTYAELSARVRRLEVENAYLKKLKELTEEERKQAQAARKKPG